MMKQGSPNEVTAPNAGFALWFQSEHSWPGVGEFYRSAAGACDSGKKAPGQKHGGRKIFRSHFSATIFLPELGFDSWRIVGMKTPTKLPNQSLEATGRSTLGLSLRQSAIGSRGLPVPQLGRSAAV